VKEVNFAFWSGPVDFYISYAILQFIENAFARG